MQRSSRLRLPVLLAVAIAALFLSLPRGGLWDDEISSLSPLSQEDHRLDELLRGDIGAPDARYLLLVNAPSEDQALAASEALAGQLLQALIGQGTLAGFDSPALALPSRAAQRARQAALPPPGVLRANLQQALVGLPFRADLFEPFLKDVAAARTQPWLDRSSLRGTSLSLKLDSLLIKRAAGWVAMLPLRGVSDPQRLREQIGKVAGISPMLMPLKDESDQLYRTYRHGAGQSLLGSLVIVVLLGASLRSPRRVYDVLAPLIGAVIITTAVLIGSGQKLSIFHLVGLSLVVAIGSNYSLFFERQNFVSQDRERTVASLLLANISTVIGFGMLSFSHIPVLHGIGMTVAIGAILSLIFSAILTAHFQAGKQ
jgi:predicted exporter